MKISKEVGTLAYHLKHHVSKANELYKIEPHINPGKIPKHLIYNM